MPNFKYDVRVLELKEIHEIPGAWTNEDFLDVLHHLEYDDADTVPFEELKEMATLALSDLTVEDAAVNILELRLKEQLNKGQRQNLASELQDDRLWEEYSDIKLHQALFNVGCMLYWTFPKQFPTPDIVRITLKVIALNKESVLNLVKPVSSFLTRLLNDGMDEHNIIYRLFDENIKSDRFPESEHIIWKFEESGFAPEDNSNTFTIYTSWNWVDELKGVQGFESTAFSDGQLK